MTEELKPCPFCGSTATHHHQSAGGDFAVECSDCGARGPLDTAFGGCDEYEAWNRRAEVRAVRARCEKLEAVAAAARCFREMFAIAGGEVCAPLSIEAAIGGLCGEIDALDAAEPDGGAR